MRVRGVGRADVLPRGGPGMRKLFAQAGLPPSLRRAEHVDARRLGDAAGAEHVGEDAHRLQRDGRPHLLLHGAARARRAAARRLGRPAAPQADPGLGQPRQRRGRAAAGAGPRRGRRLADLGRRVPLRRLVRRAPGRGQRTAQGAAPRGAPGRRQLRPGDVQGGVPPLRAAGRCRDLRHGRRLAGGRRGRRDLRGGGRVHRLHQGDGDGTAAADRVPRRGGGRAAVHRRRPGAPQRADRARRLDPGDRVLRGVDLRAARRLRQGARPSPASS